MDKLREQLKQDAGAVDATVTPALRERIDAHWQASTQLRPRVRRRRRVLTLGSVMAGITAVVIVFATRQLSSPEAPVAVAGGTDAALPQPMPIEPADFAKPLQQELNNLQADLKMARDSIERELRSTL